MLQISQKNARLRILLSDCSRFAILLGLLLTSVSIAHSSEFAEKNLTFSSEHNANISIQNELLIKIYQRPKNIEGNNYNIALSLI